MRNLLALACALPLALAALVSAAAGGAEAEDKSNSPPNVIDGTALVQALRAGGHVIYFRHGKTDLRTQDTDRNNLANCSTQRRLSVEGRQQMAGIGRQFRAMGVTVSTVLSSPYCRSVETAQLAFGKATVEPELVNTVAADEASAQRQARALRRLLATAPEAGSNTVLSGHTGNLLEAAGIWPSPEGAAVVFRPDGRGGFAFVAAVPPGRWAELALAAGRKTPAR